MASILHFADLHISEFQHLAGTVQHALIPGSELSVNAAMLDLIRTVVAICDKAVAQNGGPMDGVVIAGDLFDRSRPTPTEYAIANEALHQIRARMKPGVPVLVIAGNHDLPRGAAEASALEPMHWEGVEVHEDPCVREYAGLKFGLLPYPRRAAIADMSMTVADWMSFQVKNLAAKGAQVLVAHANWSGSTHGVQPRPVEDDATLSGDVLGVFRAVMLGHIHKPQAFAQKVAGEVLERSAIFPGSTIRQDWGECGDEPHGACLWHFADDVYIEKGAHLHSVLIHAEPRQWVDVDMADQGRLSEWLGIEAADPSKYVWRLSGTLDHASLLQVRADRRKLVSMGYYIQDNLQEEREDRARDAEIGKVINDRDVIKRALRSRGVVEEDAERLLTVHDRLQEGR